MVFSLIFKRHLISHALCWLLYSQHNQVGAREWVSAQEIGWIKAVPALVLMQKKKTIKDPTAEGIDAKTQFNRLNLCDSKRCTEGASWGFSMWLKVVAFVAQMSLLFFPLQYETMRHRLDTQIGHQMVV